MLTTARRAGVFLATILFMALPLTAQVQLGGHPYVPSSTDSTGGFVYVTFLQDADCNLSTPSPTCSITYTNTVVAGSDGPYVQGMEFDDPSHILTTARNVISPAGPGQIYSAFNNTNQQLNIDLPDLVNDFPLLPNAIVQLMQSDDGFFPTNLPCSGTTGFIPEFTNIGCSNSPIDDGVTNSSYITSTESFVYPDTTKAYNGYVGQDTVVNGDYWIGQNFEPGGTQFSSSVNSVGIDMHASSTPACANIHIQLAGGSDKTIAEFCNNGITFTVPFNTAIPGAPTCSPGAGAGTGATCTLASQSTNTGGIINVHTGVTPTANADVETLTYNGAPLLTAMNGCTITPAISFAATATPFITAFVGASSSAWSIGDTGTALIAATDYAWAYVCSQ
jgi:hypothetical protein